jgi:hypothetical protein
MRKALQHALAPAAAKLDAQTGVGKQRSERGRQRGRFTLGHHQPSRAQHMRDLARV